MKRFTILLMVLVSLLTACHSIESDASVNQVLSTFKKQKIILKEIKSSKKSIFGMKLNGVKPSSYELDGKKFLIYIFQSSKEREEGVDDFYKKTENSNTVSYKKYEVKNMLFFYIFESIS
ncbi:hypothetical protein J6TS2_29600 [Heyndrickxia sporothermodurans]|nr:hypothetical protein J6TS2_29600 [Heyndrickxia sporothermodurans]